MSPDPHPLLCAWCGRVRSSADRWEEGDPGDLDAAKATHGICPDCLAEQTRAACAVVEYP
jgi:hypothetical protein